MRKLFAFNMVSLDGFFEGRDRDITWHTVDDEFNRFAIEQLNGIGALLFGRVTYELMASYWPTPAAQADDPEIAGLMNALPKVVFSRTLDDVGWSNSRLVRDGVDGEVRRMKAEPGKELAVFGSGNLLSTLMRLDLVDEHRLMISPVLIGSGSPLFRDIDRKVDLKLVDSRTFEAGNVLLVYKPSKK